MPSKVPNRLKIWERRKTLPKVSSGKQTLVLGSLFAMHVVAIVVSCECVRVCRFKSTRQELRKYRFSGFTKRTNAINTLQLHDDLRFMCGWIIWPYKIIHIQYFQSFGSFFFLGKNFVGWKFTAGKLGVHFQLPPPAATDGIRIIHGIRIISFVKSLITGSEQEETMRTWCQYVLNYKTLAGK